MYTIDAGERGVLMTWGKPSMVAVDEGLHFKMPIAQTVKRLEVRTKKIEVGADSVTKDLQDVQAVVALNYHLVYAETPKLYQEIGMDYQDRVVNPTIQESVKAVMAGFTAEEMTSKRPEVRAGIEQMISERLTKYYIQVDGFNIIDFAFSAEYDKAIELKQVAEQDALRAEWELEKVKVEAEKIIVEATAKASAVRIEASALKENPDILQLRAIEKWDGIMPKVTGGAMPFIDIATV